MNGNLQAGPTIDVRAFIGIIYAEDHAAAEIADAQKRAQRRAIPQMITSRFASLLAS